MNNLLSLFGEDVRNRDIHNLADQSKKVNFFYQNKDLKILRFKIDKFNFKKKPIATLLFRDSNYLKNLYAGSDTSYHDYRNVDINEHIFLIKKLIKLGYFVIRVGSVVSNKVNFKSENFFDYSLSKYQNEKNDICIMALSKILITTSTGLDEIAPPLKIPMLIINMAPIGDLRSYSKLNVLIPQVYLSEKNKKKLSFNNIAKNEIQYCYSSLIFKKKKIKLLRCSKQEILEGVNYIHRLSKNKKLKQSNLNLIFWKKFKKLFHLNITNKRMHGRYLSIIPETFLKNNKHLFYE